MYYGVQDEDTEIRVCIPLAGTSLRFIDFTMREFLHPGLSDHLIKLNKRANQCGRWEKQTLDMYWRLLKLDSLFLNLTSGKGFHSQAASTYLIYQPIEWFE